MIAPIDHSVSQADPKARTLHTARRAAASALLSVQSRPDQSAKPISRPKAWLFVAWTVITATIYFAHMLGLIH